MDCLFVECTRSAHVVPPPPRALPLAVGHVLLPPAQSEGFLDDVKHLDRLEGSPRKYTSLTHLLDTFCIDARLRLEQTKKKNKVKRGVHSDSEGVNGHNTATSEGSQGKKWTDGQLDTRPAVCQSLSNTGS